MDNKIILIQLWFGKIPDYFWYHIETTKNLENIDFLLVTDQDVDLKLQNYKVIKVTPVEIENKVSAMLNYEYKIENFRKINDLKSCYGELFEDEIANYQYFGFYDIDTLFGDFKKWIFPHIPEYDVISFADSLYHNRLGGPLTIIRNTYDFRRLYRKKIERFIETLNHDSIDAFEEQELNLICNENCKVKLIYDSTNCETHNGGKNTYDSFWSGGQVFVNNEEKLLYHFYRKNHTKFTKVGNIITTNYNKTILEDFYWVVGFSENYEKLFLNLLNSIKKYSNRKCIIYSINYNFTLPTQDLGNEQFVLKRLNIPEGEKDFRGRDQNIMSCKPLITLDAVNSFPNSKFVYVDTDIYFTVNSDNVRKYFEFLGNYPLINSHVHDVLFVNNVKEGEWTSPLHVLFEAMGYDKDPIYPRRKCNLFIFDTRSKWFFEKQMELYNSFKNTKPGIFAFQDEDTANAILSIHELNDCLPIIDIEEVQDININIFSQYSYNMTALSTQAKLPNSIDDVLFFHGIKSQEHFDRIKNTYDVNVLETEEICLFYKENMFLIEKNSFIKNKTFTGNVTIKILDLNENLIFELTDQNLFMYWTFYVSNFYLDKGIYRVNFFEKETQRSIYSDYLNLK